MLPGFSTLDAHVHFWDPDRFGYDWLAAVPRIAARHGPDRLAAEPRAAEGWLFVECGAPADAEVEWVESLAAAEPRIAGIVAHARMDGGAATREAVARLRAHPLVKGVRHNIQDEADPRACVRPAFLDGMRLLSAAGLVFDVCCRSQQLPAVAELVRQAPDVSFVLDHCGKPPIATGGLDPWRADLERIAASPNVHCKISGLGTEAAPGRWTPDDLRPFVQHAFDVFGADRIVYGSDWPVCTLAGPHDGWVSAVVQLSAHLSEADRGALFGGNARRVYRLN